MPTFRNDVKLGTKVPLIKTDDLDDRCVTEEKVSDSAITMRKLAECSVTLNKLAENLRKLILGATGLPEDLVEQIQNVNESIQNLQGQIDEIVPISDEYIDSLI